MAFFREIHVSATHHTLLATIKALILLLHYTPLTAHTPLPHWSGWRSLVGKRHSIRCPPHSGQIGKWQLSASQISGSERYHHYHPPYSLPKAVGGEGGGVSTRGGGSWGPVRLRSGLRWVNSLPCSPLRWQFWAENTEKRGKNAYSADERNFPQTNGKSWPQSHNSHPLYHTRPSCAGRWQQLPSRRSQGIRQR